MLFIRGKAHVCREKLLKSVCSLCQDLVCMPRGFRHHLSDCIDKGTRNVLVKQVTHRIHKDHLCLRPSQRIQKTLRNQTKIKSALVRMPGNTPKALGECLGVAMSASRTDLRTTTDRIPRGVSPFDMGNLCHDPSIPLIYLLPIFILV